MLKLKLQYFGHLMRKSQLIRKDPDAGKDWRQEEKGATEDEMVGWHHYSMETSVSKPQEIVRTGKPGVLQFMGLQRVRHDLATAQHHHHHQIYY